MRNCQDCNNSFLPVVEHLAEEGLKRLALSYCPPCLAAYTTAQTVSLIPNISQETRKTLETVAQGAVLVAGGIAVLKLLESLFDDTKKEKTQKIKNVGN